MNKLVRWSTATALFAVALAVLSWTPTIAQFFPGVFSCTAGQFISGFTASAPTCGSPGGTVVLQPPGGRLTLQSGTPIMASDSAGATTIYYAPIVSPTVPVWNGTSFVNETFTSSNSDTVGQSIVLGANWTANTIYDVFEGINGSTATLCTGPAWSTSTDGSGARGSGAGTTQLVVFGGFLTNAVSITCRFANASTFTCAANQCTYLGSFITNGNAGQIDFKFGSQAAGGGQAWAGVCNAYNQVAHKFNVVDTNANWAGVNGQNLDNSATNRISFLSCLGNAGMEWTWDDTIQNASGATGVLAPAQTCGSAVQILDTAFINPTTSTLTNGQHATASGIPVVGLCHVQATATLSGAAVTYFLGAANVKIGAAWSW